MILLLHQNLKQCRQNNEVYIVNTTMKIVTCGHKTSMLTQYLQHEVLTGYKSTTMKIKCHDYL